MNQLARSFLWKCGQSSKDASTLRLWIHYSFLHRRRDLRPPQSPLETPCWQTLVALVAALVAFRRVCLQFLGLWCFDQLLRQTSWGNISLLGGTRFSNLLAVWRQTFMFLCLWFAYVVVSSTRQAISASLTVQSPVWRCIAEVCRDNVHGSVMMNWWTTS